MSEPEILEYLNYLEHMCGFSRRTRAQQQWILKFFRDFLGTRGKALMAADGADFLAFMEWRSRTVQGKTVARELSVLRSFYGFLLDFGKISQNPTATLPERLSEPHPESSWLTVEDCFRFLDGFDRRAPLGLRDYTIAALLWSTGLRSAELCALDWRDIDLEAGALRVRQGKGGKQRQIFFNDTLWSDLRHYRDHFEGGPHDPVFHAFTQNQSRKDKHGRLSERRLTEIIREHAEAAGFAQRVTPVSFRHSFATHMAEAGVAIEDIKEILGHDDETETTIYVHISTERMKRFFKDHLAHSQRSA